MVDTPAKGEQLRRRAGAGVAFLTCLLAPAVPSIAAPVLRSADVRITVISATVCEVALALAVADAPEIDHRVDAPDGGRVELLSVAGARQAGALRAIGRTQSLVLRPDQASYEIHYRVQLPDARAHRCPIWLPTVPADGQSRAVRLQVDLPAASTPGRSMPAFSWTGTHGVTTLGHVPAFVRVPFATEAHPAGWDIERLMDGVAVVVFGAATVFWVWRRRW